jgi:uncharacterized protein YndB with AHSA1/START domain
MMTQTESTTDRITRHYDLAAPIANVWRAIADAKRFATWFKIELDGPFTAGKTVKGKFANGLEIEFQVDRIEPEHYFSYRWHPYPVDRSIDYSKEQTTLVEFLLEKTANGTSLTITESGFDSVSLGRRAEAFRMNSRGWEGKGNDLVAYVLA